MKIVIDDGNIDRLSEHLRKRVQLAGKCLITLEQYVPIKGDKVLDSGALQRSGRTSEQNRMLHGLYRSIANFTGNTVVEIKDYCASEFLGSESYEFNGQNRLRLRTSSGLTVAEMADLITQTEMLAASLGVV